MLFYEYFLSSANVTVKGEKSYTFGIHEFENTVQVHAACITIPTGSILFSADLIIKRQTTFFLVSIGSVILTEYCSL